ncbi:MAG: hypothetical protein IPJ62_11720 [Betaproteobacteria bacterium]|nr:hypothetical protein [Betaproteobacteria bacterium]
MKEFPALLKALAEVPAELNTRLACYWTLLTACRVGEMRFATWGEIEDDKQWAIPAARMKMKPRPPGPALDAGAGRAQGCRGDPRNPRR